MTILSSGTAATPAAPALLDVYARVGPLLVSGEGAELIAADGARYLDFVAGIGVNALGYNHPVIRAALERAATTGIIHVSNLYRTEPGERLAEELVARSFAHRVFFCNSGAEANEAAFKFARKWSGKSEIVAFSGSFHGRLFATLAATDRPDYRKPFEPLVPGIRIVAREDWAAVDHAVAAALKPGDHATTFGGGPLVAGVALDVVRTIADPAFLAAVRRKAEWLEARLARLATATKRVADVRGRGLMWGIELTEPATPFVSAARERGLLVITAGPQVIRLLPPLVITEADLDRGA